MSRWVVLGIAAAIMFADTVGYTLIIPVLPALAQELGLTETWTGIFYASYGLISLVLYLPFGYVVDRVGERLWLTGGMLLLGGPPWLSQSLPGFGHWLACRIAQGVAASATWAATLPLAARLADKNRRGLEMSLVPMAFSLGAIGGPALGGIGEARDPFVYFSVFPFILAGLAFFLVPSRVAFAQDAQDAHVEPSKQHTLRVSLPELFSTHLAGACLVILVSCAALGAIEVLLPLQLTQIGWSRQDVGLLFAAWGAAALVSQPLIGLWSDRRGRQEPMVIGLFAERVCCQPCFAVQFSLAATAHSMRHYCSPQLALAPSMPLIADGLSEGQAGKAFGVYNVAFSIGIVIGPWLGGYVTEQLHVFGAAVLFAVPLFVTASALPRFLSPAVRLSPELP